MIENELSNRRRFLQQFGAGVGLSTAALAQNAPGPVFVDSPKGGFRFLKGGAPYSCSGVLASRGYEVVHVTFSSLPTFEKGFELIDRYLKQQGRPPQALCGVELRSPRQFTSAEFQKVNQRYLDAVTKRGLMIDGANPIARVNVAPELDPPSDVSIYGFSFAAPQRVARPTFLAASSESVGTYPQDIVARGDISPAGLRQKLAFVLGRLDLRLGQLGVNWGGVTMLAAFTIRDIAPFMSDLLYPRMGPAKNFGLHWYFARPPLKELELEMSVRGCARELFI